MHPGNVGVLYPKASFNQWMNDLAFCPSDNSVLIIGFSEVSRNEALLHIAGTSMSTPTKIHDRSIPAPLFLLHYITTQIKSLPPVLASGSAFNRTQTETESNSFRVTVEKCVVVARGVTEKDSYL